VLSSTVDGRSLLAEVMVAGCEAVDLDAKMKQEVFSSAHISSSDGYDM